MDNIKTNNTTKTSIFYINDFHGKTKNMERCYTAIKDFNYKMQKQPNVDTLTLSSGDIMLGKDVNTNKMAILFQNMAGVTASAIGNHELDIYDNINKVLPDINYKLLASNIKLDSKSALNGKVCTSYIKEINNNKYGIIATTPIDLYKRTHKGKLQDEVKVDDIQTTIKDIQNEVDKLNQQGINKIILLSHLGYEYDKQVAKNTKNIDVILGGHSHDLVEGIKDGENLLYSKTGEPVVITQAGRDGKKFGILNLDFDNNGIIKKVQNNLGVSKAFARNLIIRTKFDEIFGKNEVFGKINSVPHPITKDLLEPNPHGYFLADCMKNDLDADIALLPAANLRGYFEPGIVDSRALADIMPFKNKLYKVNYSEKEIVDALKLTMNSFKTPSNKPGIFYASGLRYTVNNQGELSDLYFVDKNNKSHKIDINNPRTDKYYTTITNDYYATGNEQFSMLNQPDRVIEKYPYDGLECVKNEFKKIKEPIDIKDDGRIQISPNLLE